MDECKLSIVIPLYNSKDYFPHCLDSIYNQGLDENLFEVIVVDDGSNDGVEVFADEAASAHSNMRVLHQANTGSPSIPRNRGLEMAAGKYVFFCDSDDAFLPGSLEKMIRHAEQDELDIGVFNLDSNGRGVGYGGLWPVESHPCLPLLLRGQRASEYSLQYVGVCASEYFDFAFGLQRSGVLLAEWTCVQFLERWRMLEIPAIQSFWTDCR
ncbi:MAG: glycosyltransferase [Eggerthellaceae bacterium]